MGDVLKSMNEAELAAQREARGEREPLTAEKLAANRTAPVAAKIEALHELETLALEADTVADPVEVADALVTSPQPERLVPRDLGKGGSVVDLAESASPRKGKRK